MLLKRVKIDTLFQSFCVILCTFSLIIILVHFNFMKRKYNAQYNIEKNKQYTVNVLYSFGLCTVSVSILCLRIKNAKLFCTFEAVSLSI